MGSLNIDHVYNVKRVLEVGQCGPAKDYHRFAGGKGVHMQSFC